MKRLRKIVFYVLGLILGVLVMGALGSVIGREIIHRTIECLTLGSIAMFFAWMIGRKI